MIEAGGLVWRKSTFSSNGEACVEVAWRKSSFSASNGGCVEVAWPEPAVAVRDSKNTSGPTLAFPRPHWHALISLASSREA